VKPLHQAKLRWIQKIVADNLCARQNFRQTWKIVAENLCARQKFRRMEQMKESENGNRIQMGKNENNKMRSGEK
jgi:hypothetical protein